MSDSKLLSELLDSLQDLSTHQGTLAERIANIDTTLKQVVKTLHTGNGRESVTTRVAQLETHHKEDRARIISLEEAAHKVATPNTGVVAVAPQGFWALYGKTLVPTIVAVLMALAALLTALATRFG